jgi:hypothetical protein
MTLKMGENLSMSLHVHVRTLWKMHLQHCLHLWKLWKKLLHYSFLEEPLGLTCSDDLGSRPCPAIAAGNL